MWVSGGFSYLSVESLSIFPMWLDFLFDILFGIIKLETTLEQRTVSTEMVLKLTWRSLFRSRTFVLLFTSQSDKIFSFKIKNLRNWLVLNIPILLSKKYIAMTVSSKLVCFFMMQNNRILNVFYALFDCRTSLLQLFYMVVKSNIKKVIQ